MQEDNHQDNVQEDNNQDNVQETQEEICTCPTCTVSQLCLKQFSPDTRFSLSKFSNFSRHTGILRGSVRGVHGEGGEGEGATGQEHGRHHGVHPAGAGGGGGEPLIPI